MLELLHALYCRLHDWRFISPEINGVPSESDFNKLWVQTWLLVLHSFSRLLDDHRHHDLSSQGFGLLEKALLHPEDCAAELWAVFTATVNVANFKSFLGK